MTYVIDASVAAKWFFLEDFSAQADGLIARGEQLIAPDLVVLEVAYAALKRLKAGTIDLQAADGVLKDVASTFQHLEPIGKLTSRSLRLSFDLLHPAYDCAYIALAERTSATLVTADLEMIRAASRVAGVKVMHVKEL
jgi:predicted nucleic acid-binding protein